MTNERVPGDLQVGRDDTEIRLERIEQSIAILRPELPRFGLGDAEELIATRFSEVLDEISDRNSMSSASMISRLKSELPEVGVRNGAIAFCTNGLKPGESSGSGTGVLAYFDEASSTWMSFRTDAELTV